MTIPTNKVALIRIESLALFCAYIIDVKTDDYQIVHTVMCNYYYIIAHKTTKNTVWRVLLLGF